MGGGAEQAPEWPSYQQAHMTTPHPTKEGSVNKEDEQQDQAGPGAQHSLVHTQHNSPALLSQFPESGEGEGEGAASSLFAQQPSPAPVGQGRLQARLGVTA